jgi:ADP-heptose:LPS heptosyltransferase
MIKKILVIIAHRGIGDIIYHLPLLRTLNKKYNVKIDLLSNKVNKAKEIYKNENFINSISYFDNSRVGLFKFIIKFYKFIKLINSYNSDYTILTSRATRLVFPLFFSNSKKKIIYGLNKFYFKDKKFFNYSSSINLQRYSKKLGWLQGKKIFFLKKNTLKMIQIKKIYF